MFTKSIVGLYGQDQFAVDSKIKGIGEPWPISVEDAWHFLPFHGLSRNSATWPIVGCLATGSQIARNYERAIDYAETKAVPSDEHGAVPIYGPLVAREPRLQKKIDETQPCMQKWTAGWA